MDVGEVLWREVTVNRIFVVAAVLLCLLLIRDYLKLLPLLLSALGRSRANIEIEHSVSLARIRNRCIPAAILMLAILADAYQALPYPFLAKIAPQWGVATALGLTAGYFLLRFLYISAFRLSALDSESRGALRCAPCNYLLAALPLMLASAGILATAKTPENAVRAVLQAEFIACLLLSFLRERQILASKFSAFKSFLYLCALEIVPLALMGLAAIF